MSGLRARNDQDKNAAADCPMTNKKRTHGFVENDKPNNDSMDLLANKIVQKFGQDN